MKQEQVKGTTLAAESAAAVLPLEEPNSEQGVAGGVVSDDVQGPTERGNSPTCSILNGALTARR
jgi:hypothetical protein